LAEDLWGWIQENWMWLTPILAAMLGPVIGAAINIGYDYAKTKGWV